MSANHADTGVGLCARCAQATVQRSARGQEFWRCRIADRDARFPRYPPLPVRDCPGHTPGQPERRPRAAPTPGMINCLTDPRGRKG